MILYSIMSKKTLVIIFHCILGITAIVCICISLFDETDRLGNWPLVIALACNALAGVTNIILQKRKS